MNTARLKTLPQELKDVLCIDVILELDNTATVHDYFDMFPRIVGDSYKNSALYIALLNIDSAVYFDIKE